MTKLPGIDHLAPARARERGGRRIARQGKHVAGLTIEQFKKLL